MGISLVHYRQKIGLFGGGNPDRRNKRSGLNALTKAPLLCSVTKISLCIRICLFLLLAASNIEVNPGPQTTRSKSQSSDSPITRQDINTILDKLDEIANDSKEIKEKFSRMESRIDNIEDTLHSLEEKENENSERIDNLESVINGQNLNELKDELKQTRRELRQQRRENDELSNRTRRCNLIFYGVEQDTEREDWTSSETKVKEIIKDKVGIDEDISFERVHRIVNAPLIRGCKPIIAMFSYFKDKQRVLSEAAKLKGTNISIDEDFAPCTRAIRRKLFSVRRDILEKDKTARARVKYDRLVVTSETNGHQVYIFDEELDKVVMLPQRNLYRSSRQLPNP